MNGAERAANTNASTAPATSAIAIALCGAMPCTGARAGSSAGGEAAVGAGRRRTTSSTSSPIATTSESR